MQNQEDLDKSKSNCMPISSNGKNTNQILTNIQKAVLNFIAWLSRKCFPEMNFKQISFHPFNDLNGKMNYKEQHVVDGNGKVKTRILLSILDPRIREDIILAHFLKYYIKIVIGKTSKISVTGRDDPWDFTISISDSISFNVEITSIAECKEIFLHTKHEEITELLKRKEKIRKRDLKKLLDKVSPDFSFSTKVFNNENPDTLVDNPLFNSEKILWFSRLNTPGQSFENKIEHEIEKKMQKKHLNKHNTVLIIDNRSITFEVQDVHRYIKKNKYKLAGYPFLEIWFYTGYYSDFGGNDSEFSLIPLKISDTTQRAIEKYLKVNPKNEKGILHF